jgi:hypothetical protein
MIIINDDICFLRCSILRVTIAIYAAVIIYIFRKFFKVHVENHKYVISLKKIKLFFSCFTDLDE